MPRQQLQGQSPPVPRLRQVAARLTRRACLQGLGSLCLAGSFALTLGVSCKDSGPAGSSSGSTAPARAEIVIGHYASLTGNTAHFGQDTDKAIRLATEEQNAAGGLLGRPVRIVMLDDLGDAAV